MIQGFCGHCSCVCQATALFLESSQSIGHGHSIAKAPRRNEANDVSFVRVMDTPQAGRRGSHGRHGLKADIAVVVPPK